MNDLPPEKIKTLLLQLRDLLFEIGRLSSLRCYSHGLLMSYHGACPTCRLARVGETVDEALGLLGAAGVSVEEEEESEGSD